MEKKTWQINDTQKSFINALRENGGKATLFELNYFKGYNFKTGSINALIGKGLVRADDEITYECDKVYNGVKVGTVKVTAKVYELVSND